MKKVRLYEEFNTSLNENYEVIFSDGVSQMKKFRSEAQALDFMKKEIASNKKLRDIAVYKPGMHSTTQTELVVSFWGNGSYLDNVSKKDSKLAAKKLEESVVTEAKRGTIHKAVKAGDYPATIVVIENGKVVHQETVNTPEAVPASFNVLQKEYPKAKLHVEDKGGQTLFTEGLEVNESNIMNSYYFTSPAEFGQFSSDAPAKDETKYLVMAMNKADFNGQTIRLEGATRMGSSTSKSIIGVYDDEQSARDAYKAAMKKPEGTMVSFTMGTVVGETKFRSQYTEIEGYLAKVKVK